jgi:transketolase
MTVFAPSDATQTRRIVELMATNIGPMYARVGRADAPLIYKKEDVKEIKIGKGIIVKDGDDISIIACGTMVDYVLDARKELLKDGIKARIIDMHTIKPIDKKLILSCAKETNAIITAEEHSIIGGLGSATSEILAEKSCSCKFKRMGVQDIFCESGEPSDLFEKYELNTKHIVKTVKELLK